MNIREILPSDTGVAELIKQSDDYAAGLYPAESNHMVAAGELVVATGLFVGAFDGDVLVGMGAVRVLTDDMTYGEIKRVFVLPGYRGRGLSKLIMAALEDGLRRQGVRVCRLETGVRQPEALHLYKALGFLERGPYGAYARDPLSIFMEKEVPVDLEGE